MSDKLSKGFKDVMKKIDELESNFDQALNLSAELDIMIKKIRDKDEHDLCILNYMKMIKKYNDQS